MQRGCPANRAAKDFYMKKLDQVLINLAAILIGGAGIFTAFTKFNLPEVNMSFFGENSFAIKRDIIEDATVWVFSLLALFGLLFQVLREIHAATIPERLYKAYQYYLFFIAGVLIICVILVPILTGIGQIIAKYQWFPKIIQSQREAFHQASFIIGHDGGRKDQLELKEKLDNQQKYVDINYQEADEYILQIEKLLEIENSPAEREKKIENLINSSV